MTTTKPRRGMIRAMFYPYMSGAPVWHEVPATIVGDLAVHRQGMLNSDETLSLSKRYWSITHVPTGESVGPRPVPLGLRTCSRAGDLVAWAAAVQEACPAFFDAARVNDRDAVRERFGDLIAKGRAL